MARKHILHMLTPLAHMSPFDVNMALDAGFDAVVPYVGVGPGEVTGLVQDAIFSRPPDAGVDTGIFIGGKDVSLALDMFDAAKKAMVPPFQVSVFADPAGSFTTAAAMVAKVEKALEKKFEAQGSPSSAPPALSASAPPSSPPRKAQTSPSSAMTASSA
jgi:methylene-tetrahydromethanopterin dehydrogenase